MQKLPKVNILNTSVYLPEKVLTNKDLEKMVDTSDEWIKTRTGIEERRIVEGNVSCSDIAYLAAKKCLQEINFSPENLDLIIVCTITPDMFFPSTACLIQEKLGARNAACFDLEAACAGYVYGLQMARQCILSGEYKNVLIVASDIMSKITDWTDRNTCVLFGDGAGASLISADGDDKEILAVYLGSDGSGANMVFIPGGGSKYPVTHQTIDQKLHFLKMNGPELFKIAVNIMDKSVREVISKCNISLEEIKLLIPHQANIRIINALAKKLNLPNEKVFINIHKYGNVSGVSIIIALDEAFQQNNFRKGDIIVLVTVGAGISYGAAVIKW